MFLKLHMFPSSLSVSECSICLQRTRAHKGKHNSPSTHLEAANDFNWAWPVSTFRQGIMRADERRDNPEDWPCQWVCGESSCRAAVRWALCWGERKSSQTPHVPGPEAFSSDGCFALWWWQGKQSWTMLVEVYILTVIKISKIPQSLEVFLLFQLQPLNSQWALKLTNLVTQFSSKISYYKQNINSSGHVEFSET